MISAWTQVTSSLNVRSFNVHRLQNTWHSELDTIRIAILHCYKILRNTQE